MSASSFSDFDSSNHSHAGPRKKGDLRRLKKKIDKAILTHEKWIEDLEDIGWKLKLMEDAGASEPPTNGPTTASSDQPDDSRPIISRISIDFLDNRKAQVKFDDHRPFEAAKYEAELLCELVKNDSQDPQDRSRRDALVDLKSLKAHLLPTARTGGRKCSERAMIQRICRLRAILVKAGFDGRLIERLGRSYRLRLRRQPPMLFAQVGPPPSEGGGTGVAAAPSPVH
jgi:hypothetical protein